MPYPVIPDVPIGGGSVSTTMQSAAAANGNGTVLNLLATASIIYTVTMAAFTGTVNFEVSEDGTNWDPLQVTQEGTNTIQTSITGATTTFIHLYEGSVAGLLQARARVSNYSAGTVTVTAHAVASTDAPRVTNVNLVNSGTPAIVQKTSNVSTGSVASLAKAFATNNFVGNSIVVVCACGNGTAMTVADSAGNTYTQAVTAPNGATFEAAIFYASNIIGGANTVTVTNAGSTASMAMEIYEVSGLIAQVQAQPDQTAVATGTSGTASAPTIAPVSPNEIAFTGVAVGTAAQTITAGAGWTNDSGQQNPTTPAGLFSFVSLSQFLGSLKAVEPLATFTSEPWALAAASFRPVLLGIEGTVTLSPNSTGLPVNVPLIVQKTNNVSSGSVTTLAKAFTNANTAGNSIIVVAGSGSNTAMTVADSNGNTYTSAVTAVQSTTVGTAIFYAVNIAGGANTVTLTCASSSAAMEIYEVSGLLAQVLGQPAQTSSGSSASGATATTSNIAGTANSLAFMGVGIGTAAQNITVTASTNWTADAGTNGLVTVTPAGLYQFQSLSQFLPNSRPVLPTATIGSAENYAAVAAVFRPVVVGVEGTVTIGGYNYTHMTTATTTQIKTGPGILHAIAVNLIVASATIEFDDALSHTSPVAGIITAPATVTSMAPFTMIYDIQFATGLSVTTSQATDITIVWK